MAQPIIADDIGNLSINAIIASLPEDAVKQLINLACHDGPMAIVEALFADHRVDPSTNERITTAASKGQCGIVQFLLKDERVNPGQNVNYQLLMSSMAGDVPVVRQLLADRNNLFDYNIYTMMTPLCEACKNDRFEVVKLLLKDKRIMDLYDNEGDIEDVMEGLNNTEMVHLLVSNPRVNPWSCQDFAFRQYCEVGDVQRVQLMLTDPHVDPTEQDNDAILMACDSGRDTVVRLLLADPRVDPRGGASRACTNDHVSTVELLLADERVITGGEEQDALVSATQSGAINVLRMLLNRPGVVVTHKALTQADWRGHESVINPFIAEQPLVVSRLCSDGGIVCKRDGVLRSALNSWEARSAVTLLLSVKRTQTPRVAGRLADVLREVLSEFTKFDVVFSVDGWRF